MLNVPSKRYAQAFTAPVDFETRIKDAKARLEPKESCWAARINFPQRMMSFSGLVIDNDGQRVIVLVDYSSDSELTAFLKEILNLYKTIRDTDIAQIIRAFLGRIDGFQVTEPIKEANSHIGQVNLLSSNSSENRKAILLTLALQAVGIRAVYQGGVIIEKRFIGKKETKRSWVYLPDHNLMVDPVTGFQIPVLNYKSNAEVTLPIKYSAEGKSYDVTYSSSNGNSAFFVPTYERLEQNLIDILTAIGHFQQDLKEILVRQILLDLLEYDRDLKDRGFKLSEPAIDNKLRKIVEVLTHFDALTEGFDPGLKGQISDLLRNIYSDMLQRYNISRERLVGLLS